MRSMSWYGITGVVLFVLAVLSQTPQRGAVSGTLLLAEDELTDYDGGAARNSANLVGRKVFRRRSGRDVHRLP